MKKTIDTRMKVENKVIVTDLMEIYPSDNRVGFSLQYNHLATSEPINGIDIAAACSVVQLNHIERKGLSLTDVAKMINDQIEPIEFVIHQA